MSNQGINFNTRFSQQQESSIGEGVEANRFAKSELKVQGDHKSSDYGDMMLHRQRAQNAYQQGLKSKNLAFSQIRN